MYEFFKGTVDSITPEYVVVEVGGIGYRLLVANPYVYREGTAVTIYVQLITRENEQTLYGFIDAEQKRLFNLLLSVTGIGPKSALAMIANVDAAGLAKAVAANDVGFLTKFPGIGKKTAAQIVLDLQGKMEVDVDFFTPEVSADAPTTSSLLDDALAALTALGYSEREVHKIEPQLMRANLETTSEYLSAGLRLLTKH